MIANIEPHAGTQPATLSDIDLAAKLFADAHGALSDKVKILQDQIERCKREHLADIKRLVARAAERHDKLQNTIESAPDYLFKSPRTHTLHGIRVGWQKLKGSIVIEDPERTLQLIRKHMPELADTLIRVKEEPDKRAITDLPVSEARRIGCQIIDATDAIVIRPVDSDVDKVVDALLKEATEAA